MSSFLLSIYLILFIISHTIYCEIVTCNGPCSCTAISGEECILNCGVNGACSRDAITCRDNDQCTINCDAKNGCRGASITCPANADCTVNCESGTDVCSDAKNGGPLFTVSTNNAKSYQCMSTTGACPPSPPFVPAPYTSSPTTAAPSTSPTTASPTTSVPTSHPSTAQPTTTSPTTATPTTSNPTATPTTSNPTTSVPTFPPTTSAPTTSAPTTSDPTTATPTTLNPTTSSPTTAIPTTISPTTVNPTSASPTTSQPTSNGTTSQPTVSPSTSQPTESNTNTNTPQQTTTVTTATTKVATSNDENTAGAGYKNSNPNTAIYGIIAGLVGLVIVMFAACLVYRHFLRKKEAQMRVLFGAKAMPRQLSDIVYTNETNGTNANETTSPPDTTISPPMEGEGDANTTQIRYYGYDERVRSATVATNPLHFTQNANSRRGTDISQRSHQPYVNYAAHQQMYQHPQKNMYPAASHSQQNFHAAQQQMHQQNMYAQSVRNMNQNAQHGQNNSYPTQPYFDVAAYYANYGGSQQNMPQNAGRNQQPSGQSQHPQQQLSAECQVISPMATENDTGAFPADIRSFVFGDAAQEALEEHDNEEKHEVLHEEDGTEGSESEESGETESDSDSHHTHTEFERANTMLPYMHSDNTLRGFIKNDIKMHTGTDQVELQPLDDVNEDVNVNEDNHNRDMTILSDISDMNLEFTNVLSFKE